MPKSLNKLQLIGNVGNDPEVKSFNGKKVANFSLATSESWKDKQTGEWKESTQWHRCSVWSPIAEVVEKYVKKGSRVYVEGKVKYRKWQAQDGSDRWSTEVEVRDVILLSDARAKEPPMPTEVAAAAARQQSYEDFPNALKHEDDDLPY